MVVETDFIQIIIGVGILLFAAKLMAELFLRLKLPIVLGELLAGMIIGPFALGSFLVLNGEPLLTVGSEIRVLGEIGAIVIMVVVTTIITPIWLKIEYRKEQKGEVNASVQKGNSDNDDSDDVHNSKMDQKASKIFDVLRMGK